MSKTICKFVLAGNRCEIVLEQGGLAGNAAAIDALEKRSYVAFTAVYDGGSGQCVDRIREAAKECGDAGRDVLEVCDVWDATHLKRYADLTQADRLMLARAEELLDGPISLQGEHIQTLEQAALDIEGTADALDGGEITADDTLDSRDIVKRIEALREFVAMLPEAEDSYEDQRNELKALEAFEQEVEGYCSDWRHGEMLIRDDYFQEYAEGYASDIGAMNREAQWPNNHIDWEAAAKELQQDYTSAEFDGVTYWFR